MAKRHPSEEEKKNLDNEKIPDVNLHKAKKLFKEGKVEEADEAYNRFKKGIGRLKD